MSLAQNVPIENDSRTDGSNEPSPDPFETFWRTFPKRDPHSNGDKKAAEKKFWLAIDKKGATADLLHEKARAYADYVRRENANPKYVAQATTWLNQERWQNDKYETPDRELSEGEIAG